MAFVVEDNVARERILTLGMRTADGSVEVRSGIKAGEIVVVRGAEALRDGRRGRGGAPGPAPGRTRAGSEEAGAMSLTDVCIRRPVLAWMIMAATVVFGLVAVSRIGISHLPDVDFPNITVQVNWEGAAPESIEADVVEIIEEALAQVEGITTISSTSRQGNAQITIELTLDRNVDIALADVQTKVASAMRRLPRDIDPPVVSKTNPEDQPIMWVGLSGPYSPQMLADVARYRLKERLQTLPGVGEVSMGGYLERNVRIWADASRMDERGPDHPRPDRRPPARTRRGPGRAPGHRGAGDQRARAGRGHRPGDPAQDRGARGGRQRRSTWRTWRWWRTASRTSAAARASWACPPRGWPSASSAGPTPWPSPTRSRPPSPRSRRRCRRGWRWRMMFDTTRFVEESVHEMQFELLLAVVLTAIVCWLFLGLAVRRR